MKDAFIYYTCTLISPWLQSSYSVSKRVQCVPSSLSTLWPACQCSGAVISRPGSYIPQEGKSYNHKMFLHKKWGKGLIMAFLIMSVSMVTVFCQPRELAKYQMASHSIPAFLHYIGQSMEAFMYGTI